MAAGTWIYDKGSPTGGTGGGPGGGGAAAPDVVIDAPADLIFRSDHQVEIDVVWFPAANATALNFLGVAVYLEDPEISSGTNGPMDGATVAMDGTAQMSGSLAPVPVAESVLASGASSGTAVVMLDSTMGGKPLQSYKTSRNVRIYLAAYGPNSQPRLTRATEANPTPNIVVEVPIGRGQGESGTEWARLVALPPDAVTVNPDYNQQVPHYTLTYKYTPPDPSMPVPTGMNAFGGVRILFVYYDSSGNPVFPGTDTGVTVPLASANGYTTQTYPAAQQGGKFRVYFCSEDNSQLGSHVNTLVEGTTPYADAIVGPVPGAPPVTGFTIQDQEVIWLMDGSMVAQATFSWNLPTSAGSVVYAGVHLYLVNVTGTAPLTVFPQDLSGQQANTDTGYIVDISAIPANDEVWTVAAISVNNNGQLAEHPEDFGKPGFVSPTVQWTVGPPVAGSPGSGTERAPLVTLGGGATASATQGPSADGVGMVSFQVGPWINPTSNQFGSAQVALVVNGDWSKPAAMWPVPANATSLQSPPIPTFGNFGAAVPVDFYILSDDPQGNKNQLVAGITPKISFPGGFTPTEGAIIPARSGWFDESQFSWTDAGMTADNISAQVVQVGKTLIVGGSPNASFGGSVNGQIAVENSAGTLRGWIGEQQPGQGSSAPLWGAWFGQLWVGGTSPLDAPLFVDNQGIIEVGGIAAAQGSQYPYISVRDSHGYEMGRIGAALTVPSGSLGDGVGPSPPPQLTAGAWFTQLGIGGNNISNWNILITPDTTNPLGSQFQMRNINKLSVDYAAASGPPSNAEYRLEFGNSVWMAGGLVGGQWQFPGIHIYEVDGGGNNFGSTFLNRGMVLRGPATQGYPVLVSLVTFNGLSSGADTPPFWGDFAMYSPSGSSGTPARTVYLASGGSGQTNPFFKLSDVNGNLLFQVDTTGSVAILGVLKGAPVGGTDQPVNALAYNVNGYGPVIDATGAWKGKPISATGGASQSPWTGPINGAGFALTNAGNISASQYSVPGFAAAPVINTSGAFNGAGVDVTTTGTAYGIRCGSLTVANGPIACASIAVSQAVNCNSVQINGTTVIDSSRDVLGYQIYANGGLVINSNAQFVGAGVEVQSNGVGCGGVTCRGNMTVAGSANIQSVTVAANLQANTANILGSFSAQTVNLSYLQVNGNTLINNNYIWQGGVQCTNASYGQIYGTEFGISNVSRGWPQSTGAGQGATSTFATADGRHVTVCGGIITNVA